MICTSLLFIISIPFIDSVKKNPIVKSKTIYFTPQLFGTYLLRKTNDPAIKTKYAYLIINDNTNIKMKTIIQNGLFATKVSKTGTVEYVPNIKNMICMLFRIPNFDIIVKFNNVNKYSYSFFGIEYPEIRYKQIANYNIQLNMNIRSNDKIMFIVDKDKNLYYLFDLYPNILTNRMPYVEMPFNTFFVTQILGFIINIWLVKFLNIN
jgi:hypothetical protein